MTSLYKAVIFDFFGVISGEVAQPWFEKHFAGSNIREKKEAVVAPADRGQISYKELLDELSQMSGISVADIAKEWQGYISIDPRMVALVKEVRDKGYKTALASDAAEDFLGPILKNNALTGLFDYVAVSSVIGSMKRDGKMFGMVIDALGVGPEEAFFIDDNPINIDVAKSQGIAGIVYEPRTGIESTRRALGL